MRGLIFTQFIEMVENHYSTDMVDDIIEDANLPSMGAYTAVSNYDHMELHHLGVALANRTGQSEQEILIEYGAYVFAPLYEHYQRLFQPKENAIEFLLAVDSNIHKEMRKLYPEATLPDIQCELKDGKLYMEYTSERHFADLVKGLIIGCGHYFGQTLEIETEILNKGHARYIVQEKV